MQIALTDIFQDIQPKGSFSEARRATTMGEVRLRGEVVTCSLSDSVEVYEGDTLSVGRNKWQFLGGKWVKSS